MYMYTTQNLQLSTIYYKIKYFQTANKTNIHFLMKVKIFAYYKNKFYACGLKI